jgi:hypothetical protein
MQNLILHLQISVLRLLIRVLQREKAAGDRKRTNLRDPSGGLQSVGNFYVGELEDWLRSCSSSNAPSTTTR